MRRNVLLLSSMLLAVLLASGVAVALTVVNCVEGQASCEGTNDDDTINGSEAAEHIFGLPGDDEIFANGGDDETTGGKGKDTIRGGEGADDLWNWSKGDGADKSYGEGGNDSIDDSSYRCSRKRGCRDDLNLLDGGEGDDSLSGQNQLYGGPGDDWLDTIAYKRTRVTFDGGPGLDNITGGDSKDTIYVQDGERDEVDCGRNTDTVYYDAGIDVVNPEDCENRITEPPQ